MNRRGFFSLSVAAAALAAVCRVKPAAAAPSAVEYDLGGPHAWGTKSRPSYFGATNITHTHSYSNEMPPSHVHSWVSMDDTGRLTVGGPIGVHHGR